MIIADHTKRLYDDRWDGKNILHYTGMGQIGDQTLSSQNKQLADQAKTGVPVHLFEVFRQGEYVYVGQVQLVGEPRRERQIDDADDERWVYVFPLALSDGARRPAPDSRVLERIEADRQRALSRVSDAQLAKLAKLGGRQKRGLRETTLIQHVRNPAVAELARRLGRGKCDLCQAPAPFSVGAAGVGATRARPEGRPRSAARSGIMSRVRTEL